MSSIEAHPHLRLVGHDASHPDALAVARENVRAARNPELKVADPRWVLATRAYAQLQGSTLTAERRQRVMRTAQQLGVRPFDASLIIAIVQDRARQGRGPADAAASIGMVAPPSPRSRSAIWLRWLAAIALAVVANAFLIWWITG